jgi:hypothetical protein
MKKNISLLVCALFLLSVTGVAAFAKEVKTAVNADSIEKVAGTIASIDSAKNMITVKDAAGTEHTFVVKAEQSADLKVNEMVVVKCKAGSNEAISVKPKTHKGAAKKKN